MESFQIVDGMFWFVAFLFSTTVHEAAHAYAALRGGDRTAYEGGQVSLSPIPHIRREPIGMLVVPLLTAFTQGWALGWASAPFDPRWAERYPRRAALMSAAGPAGNFAIAIVAWLFIRLGLGYGYFEMGGGPMSHLVVHATDEVNTLGSFLAQGLSVLFVLNVLLGTFNLLPLPPLDGASAVLGLLPRDLAERAGSVMRGGPFSLLGLIVAWKLFPYIASPLYQLMRQSLGPY